MHSDVVLPLLRRWLPRCFVTPGACADACTFHSPKNRARNERETHLPLITLIGLFEHLIKRDQRQRETLGGVLLEPDTNRSVTWAYPWVSTHLDHAEPPLSRTTTETAPEGRWNALHQRPGTREVHALMRHVANVVSQAINNFTTQRQATAPGQHGAVQTVAGDL
jgi:hypothetical protein